MSEYSFTLSSMYFLRLTTSSCLCECGVETRVFGGNLSREHTRSCGCLHREFASVTAKTHGMTKSSEFHIWQGMLARCYNPDMKKYNRYGGRGISICDRWKNSFENFYIDMGMKPSRLHSIDRVNNNGNYEPDNCRWITRKQNMNNTRRSRYIEYDGITKTVSEWSDELNIPYKRLLARLNNWSVEKSFTYKNKKE